MSGQKAEHVNVEHTRYTVVLSFWGDEPELAVYRINSDSPAGAIKTALASCRISEENVDDAVVFQGHFTEMGHLSDILHKGGECHA